MNYEDSRNALFPEPNAYIQNYNRPNTPKKVVFSEPYDTLPNFYINNNFKKGDCDCISKPRKDDPPQKSGFPFDFKNLLPLLGGLGGLGSGGGLGNILSALSGNASQSASQGNSPFDFSKILSSLGGGGLGDIMKLFKPKQTSTKKIESTGTDIKGYTRVD